MFAFNEGSKLYHLAHIVIAYYNFHVASYIAANFRKEDTAISPISKRRCGVPKINFDLIIFISTY
jgi:hypothetical protein